MSRRVLVTGSEGFTGRYVRAEFERSGWEVWGAGVSRDVADPNYVWIDLTDPSSLQAMMTRVQPDVVVHLAAIAFVAEKNPEVFYAVNLLGTRNLLEAISDAPQKPSCTILASSANIYGNSERGVLSEDDPANPANDYAVSKLAMEHVANTYAHRLGIVTARPFNYTGVGQNARFLVPKIVEHFRARRPLIELGNLDVARDFGDVRDVALAYRLLAEAQPLGETINICSGRAHSLRTVLDLASEVTGHSLEVRVNPAFVRENEVKVLKGNREKLERLTDIGPPTAFRDTLSWMLSPA